MTDKMIICLNNECTATGFFYEVTPAMWGLIEETSEEELGEAMPAQPAPPGEDEGRGYLDALVKFAQEKGLSGADLEVDMVDIPTKWFDSGWA